jgi:ADP-ribose pyrophosphatase
LEPLKKLKAWKTLESEPILDRSPWLRVLSDRIELPDGRVIDGYLRLDAPNFAVIVPEDSSGRIGLVGGYKHGVGEVDLQPPAGYLEEGERPLEAAQRELLEETGCRAALWTSLGTFVVSGNRGAGKAHLFLARGCEQIAEPKGEDLEILVPTWLPLETVRSRWRAGSFRQIATIAALGLALDHLTQPNPAGARQA